MRTSLTRTHGGGTSRWIIAAALALAAVVNGYLAASEDVFWPVPLALLWVGLALAVLSARAGGEPVDEPEPMPTTAREALALTAEEPARRRVLHV
ncbi:hypothetical protein UO65_3346 [Actinokineospora spheciospongiae]|uniref:Uncharacterized protein n=1 Tax=Actinokineospora spheciospongiae TaxID=909613 RepID=W7IX07_9PSEU|nr:hypothetical protein [Actinokineospora spheciospongiae]EWC61352.1 hypothetical protein UO65_3346 [Actinokineospora spheciospongiae]PWW62622.1 hypothetical protein DFQ13_105438 [Actinokineospora spheciospongiae]